MRWPSPTSTHLTDNRKTLEEIRSLLYVGSASYPYEDRNLYGHDKENRPESTPIPMSAYAPLPGYPPNRPGTPNSTPLPVGPLKTMTLSPPVPGLHLVPNSSEIEAILAFLSFTLPASILDESSCTNPYSVDQSASPRSSPLWP
ncbi:hypothetical protein EV421DRAFT_1906423 [Armillaria borealis]|uniref:Uncharacterized protein n=1 Tax=Armillaria borealis TaxID=47425 RepID=A0AA39JB86_9AGAR|nr:hypothetical protein EV421DRAFT_1906423 [Armillaria borealis]